MRSLHQAWQWHCDAVHADAFHCCEAYIFMVDTVDCHEQLLMNLSVNLGVLYCKFEVELKPLFAHTFLKTAHHLLSPSFIFPFINTNKSFSSYP